MSFGCWVPPGPDKELKCSPDSLAVAVGLWKGDVKIKEKWKAGREAREKGKGKLRTHEVFMSITPVQSPICVTTVPPHTTGVNVGSVIDRPDQTHGHIPTRSLPVWLPSDLLGLIGIIARWIWLDVALWKSPVPM